MEGMTTQDQLLGQDDIDALLAGAGLEEPSHSSGGGASAAPKEEEPVKGMLGQDDIDALLSQFDSDGDDDLGETEPGVRLQGAERISDEYIRSLSVQIFNHSFLSREPGVQVIWNALNTLPMNTGLNLNIQGMEYKTLGTLHTKHLVVKNDDLP